ncbi:MAG: diversity-generating retroelement protein Avd [Planctomycetes bacterium]|nr:diversity-generating retroelement protein Avd [Planctomycetota bacterium]
MDLQHPSSNAGNKNDITVLPLLYDFIVWFSGKIGAYPKKYNYSLGERVINTLLDILERLIEARYSGKKKSHFLRQSNILIEKLRYLIRLSKDLQCITIKEYEYAAKKLHDIGCMVGGWEQYSKEKEVGEEV